MRLGCLTPGRKVKAGHTPPAKRSAVSACQMAPLAPIGSVALQHGCGCFESSRSTNIVTNVVKTLVANEGSRGTCRALRALLLLPQWSHQLDIQWYWMCSIKTHPHPQTHITPRLLLDLNSKDRDMFEVNKNLISAIENSKNTCAAEM